MGSSQWRFGTGANKGAPGIVLGTGAAGGALGGL